jgi:hypothetical protein
MLQGRHHRLTERCPCRVASCQESRILPVESRRRLTTRRVILRTQLFIEIGRTSPKLAHPLRWLYPRLIYSFRCHKLSFLFFRRARFLTVRSIASEKNTLSLLISAQLSANNVGRTVSVILAHFRCYTIYVLASVLANRADNSRRKYLRTRADIHMN